MGEGEGGSKDHKPHGDADDDELDRLLQARDLNDIIPKDLSGKDKIEHADDALDFESEDELAEEEAEEKDESVDPSTAADAEDDDWTNGFAEDLGLLGDVLDDGGNEKEPEEDDEEAIQRAEEARKRFEQEERELGLSQVKEWFPHFKEHTIPHMNKLFGSAPSQTRLPEPKFVKPIYITRMRLEVEPDQVEEFLSDDSAGISKARSSGPRKRTLKLTKDFLAKIERELGLKNVSTERSHRFGDHKNVKDHPSSTFYKPLSLLQLEVSNWDDALNAGSSSDSDEASTREPGTPHISEIHIYDDELYNSDEEQQLLAGAPLAKRTKLDLNDPRLLFVEDRRTGGPKSVMRTIEEPQLNVSNDRAYDMLRANYQQKVRSTIGSLNIDHSMVALRLQSPFYKVNYNKSQLRSWHRGRFSIKPGTLVHFSNLKTRKRWKDKNRAVHEIFSKSSDLTLGDNAPVFLIEYSEETPLVLSGFGMGGKLINYYRKVSPNDTTRPKRPIGETHVLEEQDRSTFWNFGFVEPGNVVPTLYNQMIRSPVFQHEPSSTDFLLVKSMSRARGTKFFLRPIPFLFVSGQVFPAVQIPGPHSRKVTAASKNRLKMAVYRVLNKDPNHRLQIRDISVHFPDHNEVQNRQRLKEFMEYQRSGEDQGFWKVKPGDNLPNEEEIRGMIAPEDLMLLESMRVGQQRLDDSGYNKTTDDGDNTEKDNEGLSIDEQLAPWNLSRNFINAIQGKAMLQLNGVGDPTARGEGFSFLRTSMKGGFATEVSAEDEKKLGGHSYNVALQQRAYDEEIRRIWYAQQKSLSVKDPKRLPDANKMPDSNDSSLNSNSDTSMAKVLQITRVVRDENDVLVRETEIVTDMQVIKAYLRRRKAAEEEKLAVDQISVTDDVEANKQRRKFLEQELARLNRNADRRQARKATKQDPKLKATTRKCATCGAVGHIKTNKSCPMYNDIYLNAASSNKK